ncbi:hypothetical protein [Kitasatospora sp. NPDC088346]|uniref:hypothetical protein n=1 Tax=Kitasatospora sp. NPDC088346 TaxID=3364073 RepID=UPI00382288E4
MSSYHGTATVIASGVAISVEADLHADHPADGLASWRGTLRADPKTSGRAAPDTDFWQVAGNRWGKLRLPEGREGDFVTTCHAAGALQMEIKGNGSEPF